MIHVFKTSVETYTDIIKLRPRFEELGGHLKWNFDLEDCDKILRVDSSEVSPRSIIEILENSNFECKELE
jgi:hypothetical protein